MAASLYALAGVLNRGYTDAGGEPMTMVLLRTAMAAAVFLVWLVLARPRRLARADLALGTAIGIPQLGFTACLVLGFDNAPVALVVLLFYTFPLLVTIAAVALFHERLTKTGVVLIAIGSAGLVLAVGTPASVTPLGILLGVGAAVGQTVVILGNRVLLGRGVRVVEIAAMSHVGPAVLSLALLGIGTFPMPPATTEAWGYAVAFGLAATAMPFILFYRAVAVIGASLTALIATVEPFVAVVLAYLVLDETLTTGQLAGGALVIAAITGLASVGAPRARVELAPEVAAAPGADR